jgi:hypothetical protein
MDRRHRLHKERLMLFWWCALAVVLALVYMVTYTLLRTSADGRPWYRRLRHPRAR